SPLKAIAVGGRSVEQTQADWILRSSLSYARWGIERVFHYQAYDDNPTSSIQFGSMGLLNSNRTPRLAAQYLRQVQTLLGRYRFEQTLNADPLVDRYSLNGQNAYMLVIPDETGRTASYSLNLGTATQADVYRPQAGSAMSVQRVSVPAGGLLSLQVSETPLFVIPVAAGGPLATTSTTTQKAVELVAYPNPFTNESQVQFKVADNGQATLAVYDLQGRLVRKLFAGTMQAQQPRTVVFSGADLPAGLYTLRLTTDTQVVHQRVVLTK
ncbi:T9SS type A sorting domain-containing protein, partial [Hymenobacter sp. BT186]